MSRTSSGNARGSFSHLEYAHGRFGIHLSFGEGPAPEPAAEEALRKLLVTHAAKSVTKLIEVLVGVAALARDACKVSFVRAGAGEPPAR